MHYNFSWQICVYSISISELKNLREKNTHQMFTQGINPLGWSTALEQIENFARFIDDGMISFITESERCNIMLFVRMFVSCDIQEHNVGIASFM